MTTMNILNSRSDFDKRIPLREQVYDLLRQRIVTGQIAPGESIDDKQIAAELNISRTPVREAVKKLSDENLVDVVAQSGTRASRIDTHEVRQAFLIRRALEMESAASAARFTTEQHVDTLKQILDSHERLIAQKKYVEAIAADDQFHRSIAAMSNLNRLWTIIDISKAQLDRCRHKMLPRPGEAEATIKQHKEIIKAVASGDAEAARLAMAKHLDSAFANTMKVLDAEVAGSFAPFTTQAPR
jgi:GntR family transcriptional regulator, rspAB operon transcriptional repressor